MGPSAKVRTLNIAKKSSGPLRASGLPDRQGDLRETQRENDGKGHGERSATAIVAVAALSSWLVRKTIYAMYAASGMRNTIAIATVIVQAVAIRAAASARPSLGASSCARNARTAYGAPGV